MNTELDGRGYGTDQPGEAGPRIDRDITYVEESAGRNVGMTRAEYYARLHGTDTDGTGSTGTADGGGDRKQDSGDTGGEDTSTSNDGDGDSAPEGHDAGGEAGTPKAADSGDEDSGEGTGFGDDGQGLRSDDPSTEGTRAGTRERPGLADDAQGKSIRPTPVTRGAAGDGTRGESVGEAVSRPGKGDEGIVGKSRTGLDVSGPTRRREDREDATGTETTENLAGEALTPKQKDQPSEQDPAVDATLGQSRETGTEAAPDIRADEQRWAAVEKRLAVIDDMQVGYEAQVGVLKAKVDTLQAENDVLKARQAEHETREAGYEARISDLEAKLEALQSEWQPAPDRSSDGGDRPAPSGTLDAIRSGEHRDMMGTSDDADRADIGVVDQYVNSESDREATPTAPDRPGLGDVGKQALGFAGTLGILPPGLQLVMGGDSMRRAIGGMSLEDQYAANNLADTAAMAFGSMSPGTAVLAITASVIAPALRAKLQDAIHKIRRKD